MPFNGSGSYSPPGSSFPAVASTLIESAKYNSVVNDIATALSTCVAKDGQTTITANLPMSTYRHTGVGDAAALTDYASANQVVDNALTYGGASSGGTDTYAVSLPISPGAYQTGQRYQFLADVANTGACTVNFNSLGALSIKLADGTDPHDGAIQANSFVDVQYDGTNAILLNPFETPAGLGLVIGTDVQAYDAELAALAGLTSAADALPYFTGSGTASTTTLTSFARTLLDDTTADAFKTTLSLEGATGTTNTNFGQDTLAALTSGTNNTVIGALAGDAITTGYDGVAIGYNALGASTTSFQTVAVGAYALDSVNANYNTAVGWSALTSATSGFSNTGVGTNSLQGVTTGSTNTAIGVESGYNLTTGTNNIVIGYLTTGSTATISNEITLGNSSHTTLRCQQTTITSLSDKRDKKNIEELKLGLAFIKDLIPVSFDWNMRDGGKVDVPDTGFIAQDLQYVQKKHGHLPGLVYDVNPEKLEAGYGKLLPVMVRAIQELSERIDALEALA